MKLNRRMAIKHVTGAMALGAASSLPQLSLARDDASTYKAKNGRINQSVIHWCFKPMAVEELAAHAARMGLKSVELVGPEYWPALKKLLDAQCVSALAHITGGGITENLPRVLPRGTAAAIELGSWPKLPIFEHLQQLGNVAQDEMLRTFNMGLGMLLVVPSAKFKKAQTVLERVGEKAYTVGRIIKGERKVTYS